MKSVAVIAKALITPLGNETETLAALFDSKSGIAIHPSKFELRNNHAAVIKSTVKSDTYHHRQRELALSVGQSVLSEANIDATDDRLAFIFATSYGHLLDNPGDDTMSTWAIDCARDLGSSIEPIVIGTACSAGSDALGMASALLEDHSYDTVIIIAVDIVTEAKRLAHSGLGTMTDDTPKPFDVERNGMVLGDAAAALVLRRTTDCTSHFGELVGYGASNDASGLTTPDLSGDSVRLAIQRAFKPAKIDAQDISVYLAHGTGTHINDEIESKVIEDIFNQNGRLKILGTKGALGHSLGACGLLEFIILIHVLKKSALPPTVGLSEPMPNIKNRFREDLPVSLHTNTGITVTLGFGGFNTALIARVG
ncbi:beta-ketoacyl synthase N-terminal-like domain-containing protein [Pseudomonas frederiksbergensis]|nr:beta-ketoacyl synthase N-terminal-like domain-containing protein [Pseudomonas frederiksbergensis]